MIDHRRANRDVAFFLLGAVLGFAAGFIPPVLAIISSGGIK